MNSIAAVINEYKAIPKLFSNSLVALRYLTEEYQANPLKDLFILRPEDSEYAHGTIDVDIRAIHKTIFNPQRFSEITVLVSDYTMPDMHGIDLLKKIKHMLIKKVLLTGEAETKLAVRAFNEGLIQKFIHKDADDFSAEINAALDELQAGYFQEVAGIAIDSILNDRNYSYSCLHNKNYSELFKQICQKLKIVEYYLLDEHGSYLLADLEGNSTILAVKSAASMADFVAYAREHDANDVVISEISSTRQLPFFYSKADLETPPKLWEKFIYPATKIGDDEPFYYSLIKNVQQHLPEINQIKSFKTYLETYSLEI